MRMHCSRARTAGRGSIHRCDADTPVRKGISHRQAGREREGVHRVGRVSNPPGRVSYPALRTWKGDRMSRDTVPSARRCCRMRFCGTERKTTPVVPSRILGTAGWKPALPEACCLLCAIPPPSLRTGLSAPHFQRVILRRYFSERRKSVPSATAHEASVGSPMSFFASCSNFFPAFSTKVVPVSF